jgi:hypothetical protein
VHFAAYFLAKNQPELNAAGERGEVLYAIILCG